MLKINIAKDFNRFPSGRFKRLGTTSGEGFRELFLETPLREGKKIIIELDGTIGYGSSFLEEAFGGLIRVLKISPVELKAKIHLVSEDPALIEEILGYIDDAGCEQN
jgi:STAS-like domain of unknown function (DUF4325)